MADSPLQLALKDPQILGRFTVPQWDVLVRQARRAGLTGYLSYLIEDRGLQNQCPKPALDMFESARYFPAYVQTQARAEVHRILRALGSNDDFPLVLLKGTAYDFAGLPLARGRRMNDVDLLVPREKLPKIERTLVERGWEPQKLDSYDQRYYREWMHEIPPLKHPQQGIEVDIHHTLLPVTARLTPDPEMLWRDAVPVGDGRLRVLSAPDMVLHSAAHLFYDGEIAGSLRDLVDLHELLGHFGRDPAFWDRLPARAEALQLSRPLHYALRYCRRLLATPIPPEISSHAERSWAPSWPAQRLMDRLVEAVLRPPLPEAPGAPVSAWLLYVRSHWLRMPPWLLATHLSRKAWRRVRKGPRE